MLALLLAPLLIAPAAGAPLAIELVFPDLDDADRVEVPEGCTQLRFNGHTHPEATLTLDGQPVRVWPTGGFAGLLRGLRPGENAFRFVARRDGQVVRRTITVVRRRPTPPLPSSPARIRAETIVPSRPVWAAPGDRIEVGFQGSRSGTAVALLGSRPLNLREDPPGSGNYRGVYQVTGEEGWDGDRLAVRLTVASGEPRAVEASIDDLFTSVDPDAPPVLVVEAPDRGHAPLYTDPEESDRLIDLPEGTQLEVRGRSGDHWKVRLAPREYAYVRVDDGERFARLLPRGTPIPRTPVHRVAFEGAGRACRVSVALDVPIPMQVIEQTDPRVVTLRLFGATERPADLAGRIDQGPVRAFRWTVSGQRMLDLDLELNEPLWGWSVAYEGDTLHLDLRGAPRFAPTPGSPLGGLRIVVDPGHGGADAGAIGSTGLREKEINLRLSRLLRDALRARGAEVTLLRNDDATVSLNERVRRALQIGPDLFLSVHNNSVGETTDPLEPRGASAFHSHPHAADLCRCLERRLTALPGVAPRGVHHENFRVTRPSAFPAVLVEFLFLSHPGDEAMLLDEAMCQRLAEAVADGVAEWARERRAVASSP